MESVSKTLYIPLYGKALVSRKGIILSDSKAEEIWEKEGFSLKGKSKSKWLAYYMAMRASVFDSWAAEQMDRYPDAVVVHLGCGMDSRVQRVGNGQHLWFDLDFPEVIHERKKYFSETDCYRMIGCDAADLRWLEHLPGGTGIVVMEGISMYLEPGVLRQILQGIGSHFDQVLLLMDCYSVFAARVSRIKNPVQDVGVSRVYGLDDPLELEVGDIRYIGEKEMTPEYLIDQLKNSEKILFRKLYAGSFSKKLYRMYEFYGSKG